jgi:hypothetical protein
MERSRQCAWAPSCDRRPGKRGLCEAHYLRALRAKKLHLFPRMMLQVGETIRRGQAMWMNRIRALMGKDPLYTHLNCARNPKIEKNDPGPARRKTA